ncbi:MAG: tRNA lysidine(34) synthetase TilS [Flavobacteriaceae bacterium]|nr:tRNA lysidine(34) synthetase TilS [Flavobacteriaceae bacterium]
MLAAFKEHLEHYFPDLSNQKILLAVSGGLDSMVLVDLCLKSALDISIAHCNFKLRAEESDAEERFVLAFAKNHNLTVFSKQFDTNEFVENSKLSIQMAARQLRYDFFKQLRTQHHFDTILTAHHADDNLETFFINLSRGSGIDGLVGIPEKNEHIIRPLLTFSRAQILTYAKANAVKWCTDSSNADVKYQRNHLRHKLIPQLRAIYPSIMGALNTTQRHLRASQNLLNNHIKQVEQQIIETSNSEEVYYSIFELKKLHTLKDYMHPLFHQYGFTDYDELFNLIDAQSGKQIHSETHTILKNRTSLILTKKKSNKKIHLIIENEDASVELNQYGVVLQLQSASKLEDSTPQILFLDMDKIEFPLVLRSWDKGDFFYPSGMSGKKKLSKYFKDEKLSLIQKSKVLLLCSNNAIVWVVGMRSDARFLATSKSKRILKINLSDASS